MILELVLTVTSVTGAAVAVVVSRRHVVAAETHAADAADALAEVRGLAADLQDLTARVNGAIAEVEWRHVQQVNTHLYQLGWHQDANAREARLAEWQQALLGKGRMPVMSVAELNAEFDALAERIGPLSAVVDDEPTVETPAHLVAVYGGEPGHYASEAMPADLSAALEQALIQRGLDPEDVIADGMPSTDEDELGPDTTADEPTVAELTAGGDDRHDDDAVTLPGGGEPQPTKMAAQPQPGTGPTPDTHKPQPAPTPRALVIRHNLLGLMADREEQAIAELVRRGEVPVLAVAS